MARIRRLAALLGPAVVLGLARPGPAAGHGAVVPPEPSPADLLLGWSFDPTLQLPLLAVAALYLWAVRRVDAAHPANPVPRRRVAAFLAGVVAIELALQSGIERYDTVLFSVHMIQHVLLALVAAPLIALGAPITLLLRVLPGPARRRWVMPVLHGRLVRILAFPVVAWIVFAGFVWASHFSPLFDAALEDELVHRVEHGLYLGTALLFWWPVVAVDPGPWRMRHPARALYLFLQMPQNSFLGVAILSAGAPLYPHYATLDRAWGATPLADQQAAGAIMWLAGDAVFLVAILAVIAGWMRHEEADTRRRETGVDAARAAIREREARLAQRTAGDAADRDGPSPAPAGGPSQPGMGASR